MAPATVLPADSFPRPGCVSRRLGAARSQQEGTPGRLGVIGFAAPRDDSGDWYNGTLIFTMFAPDVTPWAAIRSRFADSDIRPTDSPLHGVQRESEVEQGERVGSAFQAPSSAAAYVAPGHGLEVIDVPVSEQPGALSHEGDIVLGILGGRREQPGALPADAELMASESASQVFVPEQPGAGQGNAWFYGFISGGGYPLAGSQGRSLLRFSFFVSEHEGVAMAPA
jgi:hypothetical protein